MKKKYGLLLALASLFSSLNAFGYHNETKPHTWHIVSVSDEQYSWKCQLSDAYEKGFYFVDTKLNPLSEFEINQTAPFKFGFVLGEGNIDFNLSYTLVCTQENGQSSQSPKTVFVIGANGPADPDIHTVTLHGSTGSYKIVPEVGENYLVGLKKPSDREHITR